MRTSWLLLSLVLILSLVACGGKTPLAADLKVIDQREVRLEGASLLSLSPDGKWLLASKDQALCFYQAASLAEQSCAEGEAVAAADLSNVAWSPADGGTAQVAFTERMLRDFYESDLWLLQAETGELTNLTADDLGGRIFDQESQTLDVTPAWSPDGKTLLFCRGAVDDVEGAALYRIPATGGSPTRLVEIVDESWAVSESLLWPSKAEAIFYTVMLYRLEAPVFGVWMADPDGQNPQRLIGLDESLGPPMVMDVSATGSRALVWYPSPALNQMGWYVLDVAARTTQPLLGEPTASPARVSNAIFSPDGSKLLYAILSGGQCQLLVRDADAAPGSEANLLLSFDKPCGSTRHYGLGLDWAGDDTLFVAVEQGAGGLLLKLGSE